MVCRNRQSRYGRVKNIMEDFPYIYHWNREEGRRGSPCRRIGKLANSAGLIVEFEDGYRVKTPSNSLRLRTPKPPKPTKPTKSGTYSCYNCNAKASVFYFGPLNSFICDRCKKSFHTAVIAHRNKWGPEALAAAMTCRYCETHDPPTNCLTRRLEESF